MKILFASVLFMLVVSCTGLCLFAQTESKEKIAKETMQYAAEGSAAYLKHDLKNAIKFYTKALDLEKKEPTLDKNIWRVVVDNLGMSYGISGDNKKAKEIFEYGLSKDDKYPMFYYNLACAHAEMNDMENAIKNLRFAVKYIDNLIPGEQLPDPSGDDSFKRFLKNEQFQKALREMSGKSN